MVEKKRLTEKFHQPPEGLIKIFMGEDAWNRLMRFEDMLKVNYDLSREIKFPFGNDYGWGFRYVHKKALLLYVFFEENGFWNNRYPCGDHGGWIHYSVDTDYGLPDLIRLIGIKVKPKKTLGLVP